MRLVLLLLMIVGTIILLLQNQQPIVIYFLGTDGKTALLTLQLSLGLWVIGFTAAGILTSFLIQLLGRSPRQIRAFQQPSTKPPRTPTPPEIPYQRPEPKRSDWEVRANPEWEAAASEEMDEDDEWNIEQPPTETTVPRPKLNDRPPKEPTFEVQKPPKTESHEGTIYSYTYRELRDRPDSLSEPDITPPSTQTEETRSPKSPPKNQVYDANYRIITPPYKTPSDDSGDDDEDEESWV